MIKITRGHLPVSGRGIFGYFLGRDEFVVPGDIAELLDEFEIKTAKGFLQAVKAHPLYFRRALNWQTDDVGHATTQLESGVREYDLNKHKAAYQ